MRIKIPHELKIKFLSMEGYVENVQYLDHSMTKTESYIRLNLKGYPECLDACIEWLRIIKTSFSISCKFDVGPYEGLWPIEVDNNGVVKFIVDRVDPDKKDWKDWFMEE